MAKTMLNRVVVWKAQDMQVPIDYLNLVLQTRPVFGFGLAREGKLIRNLPKKVSADSITKGFASIKEPALFIFDVEGTLEGDRQPFLALTNSAAEPLCYAAVEGDLIGYDKMEDARSDAYNFKEEYLITKIEDYYNLIGADIDKLSSYLLTSDAFKTDIAKAFGNFGSLTLLFTNGKNVEITKHGGNGHTYKWGHTSDALGFGLTPTEVVVEDPLAALELEMADAGEDIDLEADLATLDTGGSKLIPAGTAAPLVPTGELIKGVYKGFSDFLKDTMTQYPQEYPEISPLEDKTVIQKNGTIKENGKDVTRDLTVSDYAMMLKTNPNDAIASRVIKKWYETKQGHKNGLYKTLPKIHTVEQKNKIRLIYDAMEAKRKEHNDAILLARENAAKTETAISAAMANATQAKDGKPIASTTSLTQQAKDAGSYKFKQNVKAWSDKNCQILPTDPNYLKNRENGLNRFSTRAGVNWDVTLGTSRKSLNDLLKECGSDALIDLACEWQYELTKLHIADQAAIAADLEAIQGVTPHGKKMHTM